MRPADREEERQARQLRQVPIAIDAAPWWSWVPSQGFLLPLTCTFVPLYWNWRSQGVFSITAGNKMKMRDSLSLAFPKMRRKRGVRREAKEKRPAKPLLCLRRILVLRFLRLYVIQTSHNLSSPSFFSMGLAVKLLRRPPRGSVPAFSRNEEGYALFHRETEGENPE